MAELVKFSQKGKIGYKDLKGTVIIGPQYDCGVNSFGLDSSNKTKYAIVAQDGRYGVINELGIIILPFEYQEVKYLFNECFIVRKETQDESWCVGVVRTNGTVLIPFEFKHIICMGCYIVCYKTASSCRNYSSRIDRFEPVYNYSQESDSVVFNSNGIVIYEGYAISSSFDYLITKSNEKYGVINHEGRQIIRNIYDEIVIVNSDCFIVRINSDESWSFGVINAKSKTIIDFSYKYISSDNGWFFDCFKECESTRNYNDDRWPYKYSNQAEECWLNSKGIVIHNGTADVLSQALLACEREGRKAVFSEDGTRVVNYQYDRIKFLDGFLVVEKDKRVGILTDTGSVIIDAIYESIEFVHIDDSISPHYDGWKRDGDVYGCYSRKNVFDTASNADRLNRQQIRHVKGGGLCFWDDIYCPEEHYSFKDVMILRVPSYAELFSMEEGIIPNSRFDNIQQLTNLTYVVSSKGKYGVYRRDRHKLIIPCEYERIIVNGGQTVLLCKDGLWGATSIEFGLEPFGYTDVPLDYREISFLNAPKILYGVKRIRKEYNGEEVEEYTIVNEYGGEFERMGLFFELSSMPIYYDDNHVLSSRNGRYGFVSVKGYESVPFIYDEIKEREDRLFDVRIDDCWGVMDIYGRIIVPVRYDAHISESFENAIVTDTLSKRMGVLAHDGREKVPAVFDHIMIKDEVIYCGCGGMNNTSSRYHNNNFFCREIEGAVWGVYTKEGIKIINPEYDCFIELFGYLLAGRDGTFLVEGQEGFSYRESEYSGVYDLYDYDGHLILGGFNKFYKDEDLGFLYFHFGGNWEQKCEDYDQWGNAVYYHSYCFKEGNGRWLVTDLNLKSIIPNTDGSAYVFPQGSKCTITRKNEDGKITYYWSFPLEQFSMIQPLYFMGLFLVGDLKKQRIIRFEDGACSLTYTRIKFIDSQLFFTYKDNDECTGVGLSSIKEEYICCEEQYSLLTKPVSGYVFAAKQIDDCNYALFLINIYKKGKAIKAIDRIDFFTMDALLREGKLQLSFDDDTSDIQYLTVRDKSVFNKSLFDTIGIEERKTPFDEKKVYWFSVNIIFSIETKNHSILDSDGEGEDNGDYERDTWDAMTDGMYGDMPEGFDGDYDFIGR